MSTSLKEQLRKLAVPQSTLAHRDDKKRASLLFDAKEAATLSRETVYQIGLDGFQELVSKNNSFIPFENTLFHFTSVEFQRSVQTAEANENLDKQLKRFMVQLSPYFLLTCSHKALEWLIHRYYINEYNQEDMLMLILPYHETNIFVRVLQLITLKRLRNWIWLRPLQKPGIHLPKISLYSHAASNPFFIQLIGKYVLFALKEHDRPSQLNILLNFYCTTYTGALEKLDRIPETILTQMLRCVIKGLKSDVVNFNASTFIILSKLLTKADLSGKLLDKLTESITLVNSNVLKTESILVLLILYQSQKQFTTMNMVSLKNMAMKKWVPNVLNELIEKGCLVKPLLEPMINCAVLEGMEEVATNVCQNFVINIVTELKLDDYLVHTIMNAFIKAYNPETTYEDEVRTWLKTVFDAIERQNPLTFDKEISKLMKSNLENNFIKQIMLNDDIKNRVMLFEKLYHPSPDIRKSAIAVLIKNFKTYKEREQDFIRNAVIERMNDDDIDVASETLKISSSIIIDLIDKETLKMILLNLLSKSRMKKLLKVSNAVLEILCNNYSEDDVEVFLAVLPFLLPTNGDGYASAKIIIGSNFKRGSTFLNSIELDLIRNWDDLFTLIMGNLKNANFKIDNLIGGVKKIADEDTGLKYVGLLLLCNSLHANTTYDIIVQVFNILIQFYKSSNVKYSDKNTESSLIDMAVKNKLAIQGFLNCLKLLITCGEKVNIVMGSNDFHENTDENRFVLQILHLLIKGAFGKRDTAAAAYGDALKSFLDRVCVDLHDKIEFLLNVAVAENGLVSQALKLRCVKTVSGILNEAPIEIGCVNFTSNVVPYLSVALHNDSSEIRALVFDCIEALIRVFDKKEYDYKILLKGLAASKGDILMDHGQTALQCHNILRKDKKAVEKLSDLVGEERPIYLKAGIIKLFRYFQNINIYMKFAKLGCNVLLKNPEELNGQYSVILQEIIAQIHTEIFKDVKLNDIVWKFIVMAIKFDNVEISIDDDKDVVSILLLSKITTDIYNSLTGEVKDALLDLIVEMATRSKNFEFIPTARKIFKHIELDACTILDLLYKMRDVQSPKVNTTKRARRVSVVPTADILDTIDWKKGVAVLEFIQDKKKISNIEKLIPVLFDVLKKCLDFEEQASVEYPKQLILSSLLHTCRKVENHLPKSVFNMELVVQCIRASPNPQTHHHALLLLACVAPIIPDEVLHHIMAIFTFIGSSILRHDDAYSFQIITKIIETIIPIISQAKTTENNIKILRVFVDVIIDVPVHRRMPLYKQLLDQIGVENNLSLFNLLIFEAQVLRGAVKKNQQSDFIEKHLDIAKNICLEFSPEIVIDTCTKLFEYLKCLPENKEDISTLDVTIDFSNYTPKQFRHYKYTLVTFVSNLLSSTELVNLIAELPESKLLDLENLFKNLIIKILTCIQSTTKVVDRNVNTPQAQYWKVMLHHTYDILDSLNALLTPQMFLLVVKGLLTHNLSTVRRRVLDLLNSKLQKNDDFFKDCENEDLYEMLPPLLNIIKEVENETLDADEQVVIQTALLSLKLFIRSLASNEPEKFIQILNFITKLIHTNIDVNILASAILCLAELCTQLRGHAISCLNKFIPTIIKVLKIQKQEETPSLLLISAVTALIKIFDCLAQFLSPYIEKLLKELTKLISIWDSDNPKVQPFLTKLETIKQKIGTKLPPRIFIPAIENTYNALILQNNYKCVAPLMDIFCECVSNLQPIEIQQNISELANLFLNALQFRADGNAAYEESNDIETHVIKALNNLVLKLSEASFRPFYYKLYDWAIRSDSNKERVITFYRLSSSIAESLKSIFVLFAGFILNNIATLLDACNKTKSETLYYQEEMKNILLVENILKTLNCVCMYDKGNLINKEHFQLLMQPVVDQLDNTLGGNEFEARSRTLVIPCIVNFAIAVRNDALWKTLNYQVLLKMRDSSKTVRLIALDCLREVASKIGQDFLPLLPETVPFLAELLEDEEEEVEKACQKTVQELEHVLGESLQKYF